ncbi:MAG: hypothetical protein JSU85_08590 [Candidatus Zixiibacteriota bacterium]|nr:MAG: hypothetical protein JSU85_08590 [candidate division Zixibacteria bacterium]
MEKTQQKWIDRKKRYDNPEIVSSEIYLGMFRLNVHKHIDYPKNIWLASCYPDIFKCRELKNKDLEKAKPEAVEILKTILKDALKALN